MNSAERGVVPAGQELDVRLQNELNSETAKTEQSFGRIGKMTLSFDKLSVNGKDYAIKAMATNAFESGGIRDEAARVGAAGAAGAVIGGVIGGVKGAVIGAAVGSGGVIAATDGKDVKLTPGTIIRVRLDRAVDVRGTTR